MHMFNNAGSVVIVVHNFQRNNNAEIFLSMWPEPRATLALTNRRAAFGIQTGNNNL